MTSTLKADKIEGVTASGTVQMPARSCYTDSKSATNIYRSYNNWNFLCRLKYKWQWQSLQSLLVQLNFFLLVLGHL